MQALGIAILCYLGFCILLGVDAKGETLTGKIFYVLGNFTWQFWVMLVIALALVVA